MERWYKQANYHFLAARMHTTNLPSTSSSNHQIQPSSPSIILDGLNPSQIEAVTQPTTGITRVMAGPGSGKTKVLTCRIAHLLEEDQKGRVLAVTFTRKAASEMQHRIEQLLLQQHQRQQLQLQNHGESSSVISGLDNEDNGDDIVQEGTDSFTPTGLKRVTLGTFHSVCAKILRWNGDLISSLPSVVADMVGEASGALLDRNFAILDQGDQLRIVKELLKEAEIDLEKDGKEVVKPLNILSEFSRIKESLLINGKNPAAKSRTTRIALQTYPSYRRRLFATNSVDFDDLILLTRELLLHHEDVRENLQRRWPHLLVDEFQDTSRTQMELVKLLTSTSLFIVGDADQSIYSWRGAHVGSLSDFADEFRDYLGGVHTVYLKENYR